MRTNDVQLGASDFLPVIPARHVWQSLGISRGTGYRLLRDSLLESTYLRGKLFITRPSLDGLIERMLRREVASNNLHLRGRRGDKAAATLAKPSIPGAH